MIRVPRYTSYPTAVSFSEDIDSNCYARWLEKLPEDSSLSLYLHLPFCRQLCWFCGCHTRIVNSYAPVTRYLNLLRREIEIVQGKLARKSVQQIHFGGGSPSLVTADDFADLICVLRGSFRLSDDIEMDLEIDPRTVDEDKIASYAESGVTRVSLGVQDFDPGVQEAINRVQPFSMVEKVISLLRDSGIHSINTDLIYGLPSQTLETFEKTIEKTLSLSPDRISLFGYAHVPWMKKHQKIIPKNLLPDSDTRQKLYERAGDMLCAAGYLPVGLDHFAKPGDPLSVAAGAGTLNRNFQGYTVDSADALIGLGVSSISTLPQGYMQNHSSTRSYQSLLDSDQLPVHRGVELAPGDIPRRKIIMALMCSLRAEVDSAIFRHELKILQNYMDAGTVTYGNGILEVNPEHRDQLRIVASAFDEYLPQTRHRYSRAI